MSDRYSEYRQLARDLDVDAVALVPGPNFVRLFKQDFHSHERPLVVLIPATGAPVALVPNLELRSFDLLNFEGEVFDWRDQTGYADAFAAMATAFPLRSHRGRRAGDARLRSSCPCRRQPRPARC